jgi:hypothetical protein
MTRITLAICLAVFSLSCAFGAPLPFKLKEKVSYSIDGIVKEMRIKGTLGSIDLEIADISKMNGRIVYHCIAKIASTMLIQNVFQINDVLDAWVDAKTYAVYKSTLSIREGKNTNFITQMIDNKSDTITHTDKNNPKGIQYKKPKGAFAPVAFFYFLRSQKSMSPGTYTVFQYTDSKVLNLSFAGGSDIKVDALDKKNKIKTVTAKESGTFGVSVLLARDFDFLPVLMNSFAIEYQKNHFVIQGKLTGYTPGTPVDETSVK